MHAQLETTESIQAMPIVDTEGLSAFRAHQQHIKTLKIAFVSALVALVILAMGSAFIVSRPIPVTIIRVDNVRGAEVVKALGNRLDIQAAEVRTALWNLCIWRYRILKSSARQDFRQSYYFLSSDLIGQFRSQDAQKVASVLAGSAPEQTVDVRAISIPPFKTITVGSKKVLQGRAEITLVTRENLAMSDADDPTKRVWRVDMTYVIDPVESAKKGIDDPQYQVLNPLGIIITGYYETREPDLVEAR